MIKKNKKGFTLMELLIVIFIITLIGSLVTVYFFQIRKNVRDSKRLSDISEIQLALENYKFFEGQYPAELIPGESLIGSTTEKIFLNKVPHNPGYYTFDCDYSEYNYSYDLNSDSYKISFCLEGPLENFSAGEKCAIFGEILNYSCPSPFYTTAQINDFIENQGYIPVATAEELNNLRNLVSQTMGVGTPWEGTYLTGLDKKYIQINDIDLSSYSPWLSLSNDSSRFTGIYDGADFAINNLNINSNNSSYRYASLFGVLYNAQIRNIKMNNVYINYYGAISFVTYGFGGIAAIQLGADSIVENCEVYGDILTSAGQYIGGIVGINYRSGSVGGSIEDSIFSGNLVGSNYIGGITGYSQGVGAYLNNNLVFDSSILVFSRFAGGIVGSNMSSAIVENCAVKNISIESQSNFVNATIGGFVGNNSGEILKSFSDGGSVFCTGTGWHNIAGFAGTNTYRISNCCSEVEVNSGGNYIGGFVGFNNGASALIENSYSYSYLPNLGGGFAGVNLATISNSYWDVEVSGKVSSSGGTGKTTIEMQSGYPSVDIYTDWSGDIWIFSPSNNYPILKDLISFY